MPLLLFPHTTDEDLYLRKNPGGREVGHRPSPSEVSGPFDSCWMAAEITSTAQFQSVDRIMCYMLICFMLLFKVFHQIFKHIQYIY